MDPYPSETSARTPTPTSSTCSANRHDGHRPRVPAVMPIPNRLVRLSPGRPSNACLRTGRRYSGPWRCRIARHVRGRRLRCCSHRGTHPCTTEAMRPANVGNCCGSHARRRAYGRRTCRPCRCPTGRIPVLRRPEARRSRRAESTEAHSSWPMRQCINVRLRRRVAAAHQAPISRATGTGIPARYRPWLVRRAAPMHRRAGPCRRHIRYGIRADC